MKARLLIGLIVCIATFQSFSQITLEKKYSGSENISLCFLEGEGVKYYIYHTVTDQNKTSFHCSITIYNLNHSVFKSFNSPVISLGSGKSLAYVDGIHHVSSKLFNTSSDIEYMFRYQVGPTGFHNFVRIFNENGVLVFQCDTCTVGNMGGNSVLDSYKCTGVSNIDGSHKLAIRSQKISDGGASLLYSLPGSFPAPTAINEKQLNDKTKASLSAPMPNPSFETTKVEFQLPPDAEFGEIMVYNTLGLCVKAYKIDSAFGDLLLNNSDLASGNYTYQLVSGGKRVGSHKMMVIK